MKTKKWVMLCLMLLLTGCSGMDMKVMSNEEYLAISPAERQEYLNSIKERDILIREKQRDEYQRGLAVEFESGGSAYTKIWDRHFKIVYVYPKNSAGMAGAGIETQAVLAMKTDENGDLVYEQDRISGMLKPVTILANVATQEELGRMLIRGGFQVAAGAVNGLGASLVHRLVNANDCSGGACGGSPIINQNLVKSEAFSGATSAIEAGINATVGATCPGGCVGLE